MLMVNQLVGFGGFTVSSSSAVDIVWQDTDASEDDTNAYTFSGMAIGAADAARIVVAAFGWRQTSSLTVSSVTIGGVSATSNVVLTNTAGGAAIFSAVVPTGTTGDVVVTLSGSALRMTSSTFRMMGASSVNATDTASSTADPADLTIDIPANGGAIGFVFGDFGVTTPNLAWSNLTEDFDEIPAATAGAGYGHSGASAEFATEQTALAVSANYTTVSNAEGVAAAWGPA